MQSVYLSSRCCVGSFYSFDNRSEPGLVVERILWVCNVGDEPVIGRCYREGRWFRGVYWPAAPVLLVLRRRASADRSSPREEQGHHPQWFLASMGASRIRRPVGYAGYDLHCLCFAAYVAHRHRLCRVQSPVQCQRGD
jgi:hypothetical protein